MPQTLNKKNLPLVSVLIVNYNGGNSIEKSLKSLENQEYKNIEIIAVDNNSSDNSLQSIKKFKTIKLIRNTENKGFAEGNNIAYKHSKGKYLFLLNNDAHIEKDVISKAVNFFEANSRTGIIQNKILIEDYEDLTDSTGSFMTITGFLEHEGHKEKDNKLEVPKQVFAVKGASFFTKKELVDNLGLFDERFFMYFEETDYCWRVKLSGFDVIYLPTVTTYHKVMKENKTPSIIHYHSFKNRINTLIKNLSFGYLLFILPIHLLIVFIISFIYLLTFQFKNSFALIKAVLWNVKNLKETLKRRNEVQKNIRKVSDKAIFKNNLRIPNPFWATKFGASYIKN